MSRQTNCQLNKQNWGKEVQIDFLWDWVGSNFSWKYLLGDSFFDQSDSKQTKTKNSEIIISTLIRALTTRTFICWKACLKCKIIYLSQWDCKTRMDARGMFLQIGFVCEVWYRATLLEWVTWRTLGTWYLPALPCNFYNTAFLPPDLRRNCFVCVLRAGQAEHPNYLLRTYHFGR